MRWLESFTSELSHFLRPWGGSCTFGYRSAAILPCCCVCYFRGNLSLLYGSTEGTKPPRLRACREGGVFWLVGVLG